MSFKPTLFTVCLLLVFSVQLNGQSLSMAANQVVEWEYNSTIEYAEPFNMVDLSAKIKRPDGSTVEIPGFWDGGKSWKFRFSAPNIGTYTFLTECSDKKNKGLHKQKGSITVSTYEGENPLYKHGAVHVSSNKKYLEHADGTPFFWLADSWWHGMTTRFKWPEDFKTLTKDRKEKGFSVIQFAVGFPCDIEPFDPRGQNEAGDPWDNNWKSIRPEYFQLTDKRIQHLLEQGLMPNIVGAWGYYIKWAGVDNMQKHWRYLIARYGAYPVTWTLAGEVTLAWYGDLATRWEAEKAKFRAQWSEVAATIKSSDPYGRLLTVHPGPNSGDLKPINQMEHLDMIMCQSGHEGYLSFDRSVYFIQKAMEMYPDKPVIHGEVCFEGMEGRSWHDVQRWLFWSNVLMGTPGFSYGVEGIWQFNTEEQLFGASPQGNIWGNVPWEIAHKYQGSTVVGLGKKFLEKYEWWRLKPEADRYESKNTDVVSLPFCASIDDKYLLVYMFRKPVKWRPYYLLGFDKNKKYEVLWFDPISGKEFEGTIESNEEGKIIVDNAPIMQDWVMVIKDY